MPNYKIIGGDNLEYGPATHEEVCQWIADGRLTFHSLTQAEGDPGWKALSTFPEFDDALRQQARQFPEAANPFPAPPPTFRSDATASLPRELDVASCLGRSSQLLAANFGLLLGAVTVTWLLGIVAQLLPFIGGLVYILLEGVLYGGLYLVYLRAIRGEPAAVGNIFQVYGDGLGQLMMVGVLTSVLTTFGFFFCILPGLYLLVAWTFAVPLVADRKLEFWAAMEMSRKIATRSWFRMAMLLLFAFLPVVLMYLYAQVKIFAVAYPGFQELMKAGTADVKAMSDLVTEVARVSIPLALLNKVVLLFNLPFAVGALMYAYEDLFGKRRPGTKD